MGIRIVGQRFRIGLVLLVASWFGATQVAIQAQIGGGTPQCLTQTLGAGLGLTPGQTPDSWQPTCGQMWSQHSPGDTVAITLQNGSALVAGGLVYTGGGATSTTAAELYNPWTGVFVPVGNMVAQRRYSHEQALLGNGQVLIVWGSNGSAPDVSEVYEPLLLGFAQVGSFVVTQRSANSFSLNPFGSASALVAGGLGSDAVLASAEVYNANTRGYSLTGSLNQARAYAAAVTLRNGKTLVVGGFAAVDPSGAPITPTATAEIYDPATGKFTMTGSMGTARASPYVALLHDGRVLVVGGQTIFSYFEPNQLASAEIYDPVSGRFSGTGSLLQSLGNYSTQAFVLASGKVLIGNELYDPAGGLFSMAAEASGEFGPMALLPTGQVLWVNGDATTTAWVYQPPR